MIELMSKTKAKLIVSIGSGKTRKRKSKVVTFSGKRDLQRQYQEFEAEARRQPYADISVSELVSSYIRYKKTLGIKATTLHGYNCDKKRIDSSIGDISAAKLTAYIVEDFIVEMAETLAPKSIINTISLLRASYERAVRTGQLKENPCRYVALPKKKKPDITVFTKEEIIAFWNALGEERRDYKVGYGLALFCGMRRSEILGIREEDINIPFKSIRIHETRHRVDGEEDIVQDTKTTGSERTLAVPAFLMEEIELLVQEHHGFKYNQTDYLIQNGFGEPMSPSTMTKYIPKIEDRHGLPHVTLHGLRHTFATILNSKGIDIARISAELGHSNIGTTLNVYTHVFGNVSASSKGIADSITEEFDSATFMPPEEKKKA